jgi:hypothetical protein
MLTGAEEGMDAAVPVDAQNAPTRDLENRTARGFPQRPHPPSVALSERKTTEGRTKH